MERMKESPRSSNSKINMATKIIENKSCASSPGMDITTMKEGQEKSLETLRVIKAEWDWAISNHSDVIAKRSGRVREGQDTYYTQLQERIAKLEQPL